MTDGRFVVGVKGQFSNVGRAIQTCHRTWSPRYELNAFFMPKFTKTLWLYEWILLLINLRMEWTAASAPPLTEQPSWIGDMSYDTARETARQHALVAKRRNTLPTVTGRMPPSFLLKAMRFANKRSFAA